MGFSVMLGITFSPIPLFGFSLVFQNQCFCSLVLCRTLIITIITIISIISITILLLLLLQVSLLLYETGCCTTLLAPLPSPNTPSRKRCGGSSSMPTLTGTVALIARWDKCGSGWGANGA